MGRRFIWTVALSLLVVCAARADEWAGKEVVLDGVLHVQNPQAPMRSGMVIEPRLLWVIGGDSETDEELFGAITDLLVDEDGNTYVLDQQLSEVKVFDPAGKHLRTIGREGEGPGEFRLATNIFLIPDARLGVLRAMPASVVMFSRQGDPISILSLPGIDGFRFVEKVQLVGSSLLIAQRTTELSGGKAIVRGQLIRANTEGEVLSKLWEQESVADPTRVIVGESLENSLAVWQVTGNGVLYMSTHYDEYVIKVMDLEGNILRVIERAYESRKRTQQDRDTIMQQYGRLSSAMAKMNVSVDPLDRDIQHLHLREDGELWVGSSKGMRAADSDAIGDFDVFDDRARYVRNVRISVDYNRDRDMWFLTKDRLYVLKDGIGSIKNAYAGLGDQSGGGSDPSDDTDVDPAPPELRCYRIAYRGYE